MDKRTWVKEKLDKLSDAEYVAMWNAYCEKNGYTDGVIHRMEKFNDMMGVKTPIEIADAVCGGHFNSNDDWFVHKEMYGDEIISDCDARYLSEEWDFLDDILENMDYVPYKLPLGFCDTLYRDAVLGDMEKSEREKFEKWYEEAYFCPMYELDLDYLLEEWETERED